MIWWYKDIFIERSSNSQIEQQVVNTKKRVHTMVKAYTKLKTVFQSLIENQQNKRLNQHSYQALRSLDAHFLNDIGLIDEDLYLLQKGETPRRFQFTNVDQDKPVAMRIVSSAAVTSENIDTQFFEPEQFDKAA